MCTEKIESFKSELSDDEHIVNLHWVYHGRKEVEIKCNSFGFQMENRIILMPSNRIRRSILTFSCNQVNVQNSIDNLLKYTVLPVPNGNWVAMRGLLFEKFDNRSPTYTIMPESIEQLCHPRHIIPLNEILIRQTYVKFNWEEEKIALRTKQAFSLIDFFSIFFYLFPMKSITTISVECVRVCSCKNQSLHSHYLVDFIELMVKWGCVRLYMSMWSPEWIFVCIF